MPITNSYAVMAGATSSIVISNASYTYAVMAGATSSIVISNASYTFGPADATWLWAQFRAEESAADAAARAELIREFDARERAIARERIAALEEAQRRAQALLRDHLSPEQHASLARFAFFTVVSSDGQRVYRIGRGRAGNVCRLEGGRPVTKYCIHPQMECPDEDTMLAQKLLLETDEEAFLRIANHTPLPPGEDWGMLEAVQHEPRVVL